MRLRYKNGAWLKALSLPLNRHNLKAFKVCGVWNWPADGQFTCAGAGSALPARTFLRMEQIAHRESAEAARQPRLGLGGNGLRARAGVPLSNEVTADKWGTFYYRATLRDLAGKVLMTSNKVKLVWHKP